MQVTLKVTITIPMLVASAEDLIFTRLDEINGDCNDLADLRLTKAEILSNLKLRLLTHGDEGVYWWNENVCYSDEMKGDVEIHATRCVDEYWTAKSKP